MFGKPLDERILSRLSWLHKVQFNPMYFRPFLRIEWMKILQKKNTSTFSKKCSKVKHRFCFKEINRKVVNILVLRKMLDKNFWYSKKIVTKALLSPCCVKCHTFSLRELSYTHVLYWIPGKKMRRNSLRILISCKSGGLEVARIWVMKITLVIINGRK